MSDYGTILDEDLYEVSLPDPGDSQSTYEPGQQETPSTSESQMLLRRSRKRSVNTAQLSPQKQRQPSVRTIILFSAFSNAYQCLEIAVPINPQCPNLISRTP